MSELVTQGAKGLSIPGDADVMGVSYNDLLASGEYYSVPGFGLVDDKDLLLGVPHIIIGVTFQLPTKISPRGYVSCRAIIGNEESLQEAHERNWVPNGGTIPFKPEERIIYNDGSTGIRRQVVEMMDKWGLIEVGHTADYGDKDRARYDIPWTEWDSFSQSALQGENAVPEFVTNHLGNLFAIHVKRGLRVSRDYINNDGIEGTTYYL